jgi:hypothetical protein
VNSKGNRKRGREGEKKKGEEEGMKEKKMNIRRETK